MLTPQDDAQGRGLQLFQGAVVIIGGAHTRYLASALRGLEAQREAHEQNIANVETPGFRAHQVSFEDSLRRAISSERPDMAGITTSRSTAATRIDGNNVRLDEELTSLETNLLHQRLLTQAVNHSFRRLRAALGSGA